MDMTELERARDYAESLTWRLETLQSRARYDVKTGKLTKLPTRLRRFSNGIPQDNVARSLAALEDMAPYSGVVFNGEDDSELRYRPTNTWIRKDKSLESDGGDATYTIVQDLILIGEPDAYAVGEAASCSNVVTSEYYWDEADVKSCPDPEQGVSYQVANVSRDKETDLFSFSVRRSVAITQHMPEAVAECSEDQTVTVEMWDNVYGEPGAFRYDSERSGGGELVLPAPCSAKQGDLVQIGYTENSDCTYKVEVRRTSSKVSESAEYVRMRDRFQSQAVDLVSHARAALPKAGVEYSGGTVTRYDVKENPDGTFENRTTVTTEREVQQSVVSRSVMPFQVKTERTDANVASAATGLLPGVRYGSYESTKTPGGLFTNKYVSIELVDMDMGLSCRDTLFLHTHQADRMVKTLPDLASFHVPKAAGGVVTEVKYRVDGDGSIVETTATSSEHGVERTVVEKTVSPRYVQTRQTDRSMASPASSLPSGAKYGSFKATRTDGGLYDNEYSTFTPVYAVFGYECSATVFQHQHMSEAAVPTMDAAKHVDSAKGGVVHKVSARTDDNGVIVRREEVTEEKAVEKSVVSKTVTARQTTTRRTDTNMKSPATSLPSGAKYGSFTATVTPGGLYVNEYMTTQATKATFGWSCVCELFQEKDTVESTVDSMPSVSHQTKASGGKIEAVSYRQDEDGVVTKRVETTKENEVVKSTVEKRVAPLFTYVHQVDSNQTSPVDSIPGGKRFGSFKATKTPGGLYVNEFFYYDPKTSGQSALECTSDMFRHEHTLVTAEASLPATYEAPAPGGGVVSDVSFRQDETGVVTKTLKTVTEKAAANASVETRKSPLFTYEHRIDRNQKLAIKALPSGAKFGTFKATLTPGGLYDNESVVYRPETSGVSAEECVFDIFRHEHTKVTATASIPSGTDVPKASGGVIQDVSYRQDETGVVTKTEKKTTEQAVEKSVVETRKAPLFTAESRTDSNQKSAATGLPNGKKYGTYKSTKTPGGLYNNEFFTYTPETTGRAALECLRDLFHHEHTLVTAVAEIPSPGDVEKASGGVIFSTSYRQDEMGVVTKTERKTTEEGVEKASVETRKSPLYTSEHRVDRNQRSPASGLPDGKTFGTYKFTRTPGGLYDNEFFTYTPETAGRSLASCVYDYFRHEDVEVTAVKSIPDKPCVKKASGGVITEESYRQDETGVVSKTKKTVTEVEAVESLREERKTPLFTYVHQIDRNRTTKLTAVPDGKTYGTFKSTRTPGGLYDNEYFYYEPETDGVSAMTCLFDLYKHEHTETEAVKSMPKAGTHRKQAKGGTIEEVSYRSDDTGLITKTTRTTEEQELKEQIKEVRKTPLFTYTHVVDLNQKAALTAVPDGKTYGSYKSTKTPGGLFVNEYHYYEPDQDEHVSTVSCTIDLFKHEHVTVSTQKTMPDGDTDVKDSPKKGTVIDLSYREDETGVVTKTEKRTTELEVERSVQEIRVTPLKRTIRTVTTNTEKPIEVKSNDKRCRTVRNTKTPGSLYVTEETETERVSGSGTVLKDCRKDLFQHVDITEEARDKMMADSSHVDGVKLGGKGETIHVTDRMDDDGLIIHREEKVTEETVEEVERDVRVTKRGKTVRTVNRGQEKPEKEPRATDDPKTVRNVKSPNGLYTTETIEFEPPVKEVEISKGSTRDVFHEEQHYENLLDSKDLSAPFDKEGKVEKAEDGVIYRIVTTADENGIVTKRSDTTTETEFEDAEVRVAVTPRAKTVRKTFRNRKSVRADQLKDVDLEAGISAKERITNPGKTVNEIEVEVEPNDDQVLHESCNVSATKHVHRKEEVVGLEKEHPMDTLVGTADVKKSEKGVSYSEDYRVGDDGVVTRETTKVTELARKVSSRVHEDALQAYQVIESTSDAVNFADLSHSSPGFTANDKGPNAEGDPTEISAPSQKMSDSGTDANATKTSNRGAKFKAKQNLTTGKSVPQGGFEPGVQIQADSELTEGGNFHSKEYKYVAKPQKWCDELDTDFYVMKRWTFRNLTQAEIKPLVNDIATFAATYNYGTFTVHPQITRQLNDFGLFDGSVGVECRSPLTGDRVNGSPQKDELKAYTKVTDWWEKEMSVTPLSNMVPGSSGYVAGKPAWFSVRIVWIHYEQGYGCGEQHYKNFVTDHKNSFWKGSRHTYNRKTQDFDATFIKEIKTKAYLVPGSNLPAASSTSVTTVLENNAKNIDKVGEEGKDEVK